MSSRTPPADPRQAALEDHRPAALPSLAGDAPCADLLADSARKEDRAARFSNVVHNLDPADAVQMAAEAAAREAREAPESAANPAEELLPAMSSDDAGGSDNESDDGSDDGSVDLAASAAAMEGIVEEESRRGIRRARDEGDEGGRAERPPRRGGRRRTRLRSTPPVRRRL